MRWSASDSLAACPAGDRVVVNHPAHPHPSRLRIGVEYFDHACQVRGGVPPESIWVTYSTSSGNARLNDQGLKIFADDSTDGCGFARITVPSLSGCGQVSLNVYVAGVFQGGQAITVRSTDLDADGRATGEDFLMNPCDLDYGGAADPADASLVLDHSQHWHRQALHETLVRRTNLRDTRKGNNSIGDGGIAWAPTGRRVAYSSRDTCPSCSPGKKIPCRIKWVPSDPALGNTVRNLTFNGAPGDAEDYNPSWSPLGGFVYYDRADRVIRRKGVPGLSADTSDIAIIGSSDVKTEPAVSPDGDSLAYVQFVGGLGQIFIAPATGGTTRQLTSGTDAGWNVPQWSPDGAHLIAMRRDQATGQHTLHRIRVRDAPSPMRFYPPPMDATTDARWPVVSADNQVVVAGVGPTSSSPHTTHALDGTQAMTAVAIQNYPAHTFFALFPRLSPDGTRLALLAKDPEVSAATLPQLWAARRNLSLPPQITQVGTQSVADSTTVVAIGAKQGLLTSVQILASDPEGDSLTCSASFLQDGMTFNPASCTLNWVPSAPVGTKFHVVFQVTTSTWPQSSGGSDVNRAGFPGGSIP